MSKVKTFSDERLTFTEEQVKCEASRCLSCGAAKVDPGMCHLDADMSRQGLCVLESENLDLVILEHVGN